MGDTTSAWVSSRSQGFFREYLSDALGTQFPAPFSYHNSTIYPGEMQ